MKGEQVREKLAREILRKLRLVRELCGCMLMRRTSAACCQAAELSTAPLRRLRKQRRRMIGISYAMKCLQISQRCWTSRRGVRPSPCFCLSSAAGSCPYNERLAVMLSPFHTYWLAAPCLSPVLERRASRRGPRVPLLRGFSAILCKGALARRPALQAPSQCTCLAGKLCTVPAPC